LFPQGLKARFIQPFWPLRRSGLHPCEKKGHLSWGDASLAPGGYQSAPLALNGDFQDERKPLEWNGQKIE
jgi:hypothetical protein